MKAKKILKKIQEWERENAESFNDYFSHDTINDLVWAGWLIGKGFVEHGNIVFNKRRQTEFCLDQELLYNIYPEYTGDDEYDRVNALKNKTIMAEFIQSNWYYLEKFEKFLKCSKN